jgi:hypothetical protein
VVQARRVKPRPARVIIPLMAAMAILVGGSLAAVKFWPSTITASPQPESSAAEATVTVTRTPLASASTSVTVRRSTGKNPLVLSDRYYADLDSTDPSWDVHPDETGDFDIGFYGYNQGAGLRAGGNSDLAVVSGSANYDTCLKATSYESEIEPITPGSKICVRTSDQRFAFITVDKLSLADTPESIELSVVVWDPPSESAPVTPIATTHPAPAPEELPVEDYSTSERLITYTGIALLVATITVLGLFLLGARKIRRPHTHLRIREYGRVMAFLTGWLTAWDWAGLLSIDIKSIDYDRAALLADRQTVQRRQHRPSFNNTLKKRYGIGGGGDE